MTKQSDPILLVCRVCGDEFAAAGRGRTPMYCSNTCRQESYLKRRIDRAVAEALELRSKLEPELRSKSDR